MDTINACPPGAIRSWVQAENERAVITAEREKADAEAKVAAQIENQPAEDLQWEARKLGWRYTTMLFAVPRRAWTTEHNELYADLQKAMARFENRRAPA